MKKNIINTLLILFSMVIVFLLYLLVTRDFKQEVTNENFETIKVDTVIDTIYVRKTTYVPKIVYRDTSLMEKYRKPMDTVIKINDCYYYNVVIDTLVNDSVSRVIITDTLFMNTIISRTPDLRYYVRNYRTRIVRPTTVKPGLYAGIMSCGNKSSIGLGAAVNYVIPGKSTTGLSYDFVNKQLFISHSWYLF